MGPKFVDKSVSISSDVMLFEGMAMMADQERPVNLYRDTPFSQEQGNLDILLVLEHFGGFSEKRCVLFIRVRSCGE